MLVHGDFRGEMDDFSLSLFPSPSLPLPPLSLPLASARAESNRIERYSEVKLSVGQTASSPPRFYEPKSSVGFTGCELEVSGVII